MSDHVWREIGHIVPMLPMKRNNTILFFINYVEKDDTLILKFGVKNDGFSQYLSLSVALEFGVVFADVDRVCRGCLSVEVVEEVVKAANTAAKRLKSVVTLVSAILEIVDDFSDRLWPNSENMDENMDDICDALASSITDGGVGFDVLLSSIDTVFQSRHQCDPWPAGLEESHEESVSRASLRGIPPLAGWLIGEDGQIRGSRATIKSLQYPSRRALVGIVCASVGRLEMVEEAPMHGSDLTLRVHHPSHFSFETERKHRGSWQVFHGTYGEHVWGIVQGGLRSKSGSKGERRGAAMGDGVYSTESLNVAKSFASFWQIDRRSTLSPFLSEGSPLKTTSAPIGSGARAQCVFVCEVLCPRGTRDGGETKVFFKDRHRNTSPAPESEDRQILMQPPKDAYVLVQDASHIRVTHLLLFGEKSPKPVDGPHLSWMSVICGALFLVVVVLVLYVTIKKRSEIY